MNQIESAEYLGLSRNYFAVIKKNHQLVYRFMLMHGKGNLVTGYYKYSHYRINLSEKFAKIYFTYKTGYYMALEMYEIGVYDKLNIAVSSVERLIASSNLSLPSIRKIKRIIRTFK